MRSTELGCFRSCSWCFWKALDEDWCIDRRKVGCFVLFCIVIMRSTELGCFRFVFLVSLESSRQGGVHGLGFMMFGLMVQKFLNDFLAEN